MQQIDHKLFRFLLSQFLLVFIIFSKVSGQENLERILNIGLSSGVYQIDYKHTSAVEVVSGRTIASQPSLGVMLFADIDLPITPKYLPFSVVAKAGYNYNFPVDNLSVSYSFANICLKSNLSFDLEGFVGIGALYSSWNQEINGGIGWQMLIGAKNSENLYFGLRYLSIPASKITGSYQSNLNLYQTVFDMSISL